MTNPTDIPNFVLKIPTSGELEWAKMAIVTGVSLVAVTPQALAEVNSLADVISKNELDAAKTFTKISPSNNASAPILQNFPNTPKIPRTLS